MRTYWQGETIPLEYTVLDSSDEAADLSGATVEFSLEFPDRTVETIEPEIASNIVSVALLTDKTTQAGLYRYQFSVTLGEENKKELGVFKVLLAVKI